MHALQPARVPPRPALRCHDAGGRARHDGRVAVGPQAPVAHGALAVTRRHGGSAHSHPAPTHTVRVVAGYTGEPVWAHMSHVRGWLSAKPRCIFWFEQCFFLYKGAETPHTMLPRGRQVKPRACACTAPAASTTAAVLWGWCRGAAAGVRGWAPLPSYTHSSVVRYTPQPTTANDARVRGSKPGSGQPAP